GKVTADPVILYFADGSTAKICCSRDYLLDLLVGARDQANLTTQQGAHLDLVLRSVGAGRQSDCGPGDPLLRRRQYSENLLQQGLSAGLVSGRTRPSESDDPAGRALGPGPPVRRRWKAK